MTHREMRNNSDEILRAVAAGESVRVINNGQVAAIISPPSRTTIDDLVAAGQARRARQSRAALATIRRRKIKRSSAELIADARGHW